MKVRLTDKAIKQYRSLPVAIQKKTRKQFGYLTTNFRHPSLHAKSIKEIWCGRHALINPGGFIFLF